MPSHLAQLRLLRHSVSWGKHKKARRLKTNPRILAQNHGGVSQALMDKVHNNFAGISPIDDFFTKYLPRASPTTLNFAHSFPANSMAATDVPTTLLSSLRVVVSTFPAATKPILADSVFRTCPTPHIVASLPGLNKIPDEWCWYHAATVIHIHEGDSFNDDGSIRNSATLLEVLGSARGLLSTSNACFVFVVLVFGRVMARILRFDHAGFRASGAFNWLNNPTIFHGFLSRLYSPDNTNEHIYGRDGTVSFPDALDRKKMFSAICRNPFYKQFYHHNTWDEATESSLWITVIRDHGLKPQVVRCFTLGLLYHSDRLFSRATRVYRVLLEDDADEPVPTVYALKDTWREVCRRPERDFYDVIHRYCELRNINSDGMAKCCGSLDLSNPSGLGAMTWDSTLHRTCSAQTNEPGRERSHMRMLLTPVGRRLSSSPSMQDIVLALYNAILQHNVAYEAGVLHRDVSDGNVLFREGAQGSEGFLLDWDHAEFTHDGLVNFNMWFPGREHENTRYQDTETSLKEFTGTLPFVAIEILGDATITHGAHHDLESFYWLLIWMILRHTQHTHPFGESARSRLFHTSQNDMKLAYIRKFTPIDHGSTLFHLIEGLRRMVRRQNPPEDDAEALQVRVQLTHEEVRRLFEERMQLEG